MRRGHLPRRGLAASASGSPRAPRGRPGALGPTRLGYGTGEVWGWGASGDRAAPPPSPRGQESGLMVVVGELASPRGSPGSGGDPSARPVPSDPLRAPGDIRPPAEHGWCRAASRHFHSAPPARLPGRAMRAAANRGARPVPATRPWGPAPLSGPGSLSESAGPRTPAAGASAGPRVVDRWPPSPPPPLRNRKGKEAGSLSPEPGLCSGTR